MKRLETYKKQMDEAVFDDMREFAEDYEDYDERLEGISECESLLEVFLEKLDTAEDMDAALEAVQWVVEAINELNERYDDLLEEADSLIETEEREAICEYIFGAMEIVGFPVEDITEEWRLW